MGGVFSKSQTTWASPMAFELECEVDGLHFIKFSRDGRSFVSVSYGFIERDSDRVVIWVLNDAGVFKILKEIRCRVTEYDQISFSADGRLLYIVGDFGINKIEVYNLISGMVPQEIILDQLSRGVAKLSPDGSYVVIEKPPGYGSDIYKLRDGFCNSIAHIAGESVIFSPSGSLFFASKKGGKKDGIFQFTEVSGVLTCREILSLDLVHGYRFHDVIFHEQDKFIGVIYRVGGVYEIVIYVLYRGQYVKLSDPLGLFSNAALISFSACGDIAIVHERQDIVMIYDVSAGIVKDKLQPVPGGKIKDIKFACGGKCLVIVYAFKVMLLNYGVSMSSSVAGPATPIASAAAP